MMKLQINFFYGLILSILTISTNAQHEYSVLVRDNDLVHVEASLKTNHSSIYMPLVPSNSDPDGPVRFVKNLAIVVNEKELKYEGQNTGQSFYQWDFSIDEVEEINISYDIELKHETMEWPFGMEEISYTTGDGFMIIGRYLFIVPNFDQGDTYEISFDLPKGWKASTPWTSSKGTISGLSSEDIRNNSLYIGNHKEEKIELDGTTIKLVIAPTLEESKDFILSYLSPNLEGIMNIFGGAPQSTYLVVIQEGEVAGGAFNNSYNMMMEKPITQESASLWAHGMIHETFHLWNGKGLIPNDASLEWFKEGVTEYMAMYVQRVEGTLDMKSYEKKIENAYRRYFYAQMFTPPIALSDAGSNKNANRLRLYGLGTLVALILDIEVRLSGHPEIGLDAVLKKMYLDKAASGGLFGIEDIKSAMNSVAGKDLSPLLNELITQKERIDVNKYLNRAGLHVYSMYDEAYLIKVECSEEEQAVRSAILR